MIKDVLFNLYDAEWERTHDIESKASSFIGFTGIIFTLIIGTICTFLANANEEILDKALFTSFYSKIMIFLIVLFMVLSIVLGIMALTVKEWKYPLADKFLDMCKKKHGHKELTHKIFSSYESMILTNTKINNEIASDVKWSQWFFLLSIIVIAVYFISVLSSFV